MFFCSFKSRSDRTLDALSDVSMAIKSLNTNTVLVEALDKFKTYAKSMGLGVQTKIAFKEKLASSDNLCAVFLKIDEDDEMEAFVDKHSAP